MAQPACPPIPTLDELLNSGQFIQVPINELVPNEFAIYATRSNYITCVEILEPQKENYITYRNLNSTDRNHIISNNIDSLNSVGDRFFRKKNPRADYDEVVTGVETSMADVNLPPPPPRDRVFGYRPLSDTIGSFLGPSIEKKKGGRRKSRRTKGTRGTRGTKRRRTKTRRTRRFRKR